MCALHLYKYFAVCCKFAPKGVVTRHFLNLKYIVGTHDSTVEQLMVVMRERTATEESEQQH
jgi:hypothetical protein